MSNGGYIYSKDKKVNLVLNNLANFAASGAPHEDYSPSNLREANGFSIQNTGCFSVPIGGPILETPVLSEEELNMIIDFEEENQRLGNFDRIFPLQSNAVHYSRFFEYQRPSNEFLARYLVSLPRGCRSIS